jgi:hypothetical protein
LEGQIKKERKKERKIEKEMVGTKYVERKKAV